MKEQTEPRILAAQAKSGDRAAFEKLIAPVRERLSASIKARLDQFVLRSLEADDILQEVSVRALQSMDRFEWRDQDSFYRYLSGIARHVILKSMERDHAVESLELVKEKTAGGVPPSVAMRREERLRRLEGALQGLSPEHREVLILARIEGLSMEEIGRRMHRSTAAAKRLASRALASLRKNFSDTESLHLPHRELDVTGGGDAK